MKDFKFSKNLNDLLISNKMTQQTLADMLGTTQATVNRWINGKNQPNLETLMLISIIFNETTDFLLGKEELSEEQVEEIKKSLFNNIYKK